ncbi:hypothetical protein D5086_021351 [Populus alba]|uniref:Uncharacterized protein n=1 Tax=Populus alba TaxID=43335 RepID=A0ACC4BBX1_POPAL
MIKHQEERLKKQRRKGGFDYPKSSETAEANKRTLEIEVDKDDRLDIELPEEKKFNEEKIVDKMVKPDIEVFLNSSLSTLSGEPDVLIMGALNDYLEEKQRELEKLPMEQAEKERLAEEQRQREAEKAASEADRAQARAETEKRRGMLQELMKKTARSVDDVWYIEPSEFKGEDMVKLYLTKVQFVSSDTREAAWWSANGMFK